jgi:drug/metabolite transporter (DMT)-like permease
MDNTLIIICNTFLLLFIFLAGGINKIMSFQGTVEFLKTKINAIQLNPIFIAAVASAILYFYVILILIPNGKTSQTGQLNVYLFFLIGIVFVGIPALAYFKKLLNKSEALVSFVYNTAIAGVIGLLTFGSLLILYSLYTSKYEEYAYVATIGLAVFTAMTILIFHFPTNPDEMISFTKNLSIFGGLMLLSQRFSRL